MPTFAGGSGGGSGGFAVMVAEAFGSPLGLCDLASAPDRVLCASAVAFALVVLPLPLGFAGLWRGEDVRAADDDARALGAGRGEEARALPALAAVVGSGVVDLRLLLADFEAVLRPRSVEP